MQPIDPQHNYAHCGGPLCCAYCAAILSESPERGYQRMTAENHSRGLRTAAERTAKPPDPYAEPLRKLTADLPVTRWPEPPVARSARPGDYSAPDPYARQLSKMKKEQR